MHTVVKPGDKILAGSIGACPALPERCSPLLPARANRIPIAPIPSPWTPTHQLALIVSSYITFFGKFRVVHMGDLTWNKEMDLMCPNNRLGTADLLIVSHHGQPISNSPALVHALAPRVAILNNGTRKGDQPEAMKVIYSSPGLEDLWQLHFSLLSGEEFSAPGLFVASLYDDQPLNMPLAPLLAPEPQRSAPAGETRLLDQSFRPAQRHLHRLQPPHIFLQNLQTRPQLIAPAITSPMITSAWECSLYGPVS